MEAEQEDTPQVEAAAVTQEAMLELWSTKTITIIHTSPVAGDRIIPPLFKVLKSPAKEYLKLVDCRQVKWFSN